MAGKEIYIGRMLQNLDAKMDIMSANLIDMTNRLISVGANVTQCVDSLKVSVSDSIKKTFSCSARTKVLGMTANATPTYLAIESFKSLADGKFRVRLNDIAFSGSGGTGTIDNAITTFTARVLINNIAVSSFSGSGNVTGCQSVTVPFPNGVDLVIAYGDVISLQVCASTTGMSGSGMSISFCALYDNIDICYDIVDLVSDGAFV